MKKTSPKNTLVQQAATMQRFLPFLKSFLWFSIGALLGILLFIGIVFFYFQNKFVHSLYPGISIDGVDFGGQSLDEVKKYFEKKNEEFQDTQLIFTHEQGSATASAKNLNFGYDTELLAVQSYSIGRTKNISSDIYHIYKAYLYGINLPASYRYSDEKLQGILRPIVDKVKTDPKDALFTFEQGRVVAFSPSIDGQDVDMDALKNTIRAKTLAIVSAKPKKVFLPIPIKIHKPKITTEKVNNLGIKELVGEGTSLFQGSIPGRVYNITLASSRLNGVLIPPGEVFSFNRALGDVSAFTGYKQAYVIQSGKTVLGDGGGVCQVSTTFFRAILNAGLPIVERNAHAYRVSYYEQDSPPGLDATIYVPSVDLTFKNDTDNYLLIQTVVDAYSYRLTISLYGTKDARQVTLTKPIITGQIPAPEPEYQDDPNLPKGEVKQVDFAAAGATVYFTRTVIKNDKVIISDKFTSRYRPWKAVFLRGTKEG